MASRRLVTAVLVGLAQAPSAQTTVPATQPAPAIPVAASTLLASPDQYVGSLVSMTAEVTQVYGTTAFAVGQSNRQQETADVLVVSVVLTAPVQPGSSLTIVGEVIRFDAGTLAARMKETAPPLTGEVVERYRGRPAIIAVSIVNDAMIDLARRLRPPMTRQEEAYSRIMKQVGPAFTALRQAGTAANGADAGARAAELERLFGDAIAFWRTQPHPDALAWAEGARKAAAGIGAAAGKGHWDEVKTAVPKLQRICGHCHTAYRERLDDGSYRYKRHA